MLKNKTPHLNALILLNLYRFFTKSNKNAAELRYEYVDLGSYTALQLKMCLKSA